jgi:hypothetical protein
MNEKFKELAIKAGLYVDLNGEPWPRNMTGEDIEGAYQKFAELIIKNVIQEVEDANVKHCCGTTYDLGVAECAQDKIVIHLEKQYNVKRIYGVTK